MPPPSAHVRRLIAWALAWMSALCFVPVMAATPVSVLFVGNSYTFGRVAPVLNYNADHVHDLTAAFNARSPRGTNSYPPGTPGHGSFEPHPWGGVPGIFERLTREAGLDYDVSLSTRNAASLRGHFLDIANKDWDLRGNVASRRWDVVVLQERSDGALPAGKGRHADPLAFVAYANQFERFIHDGAAQSYTETQLYGGLAACESTGLSAARCAVEHVIPANPHADPRTRVYLEQTWARPDMVEPHLQTRVDLLSPDGRPVVRTAPSHPRGLPARTYYPSLRAMTADLHAAFYGLVAANPRFAGVVPVGDAFQRAVDQGLAPSSGFYGPEGAWREPGGGTIDLWWRDRLHASKYGSYLSALVLFGSLTGVDPAGFGPGERAAADLGIAPAEAVKLQRVAAQQLRAAGVLADAGRH